MISHRARLATEGRSGNAQVAVVTINLPKTYHSVNEFLACVQLRDENVSQFAAELKYYLAKRAGMERALL